jgi:thiol-disulfide isomerase/thioredoxin
MLMTLIGGGVPQCGADSAIKLQNLQGAEVEPLRAPHPRATVFIFTRTDCPISNRYAPVIQELNEEFAAKGVVFWLVYVDPHQSAIEIRQHVKDYHYDGFHVALDPKHTLAKFAAAVVTPEAAVFSSQGQLLYHGRIDNRYVGIGRRLPAPTRKDLELTLHAIVAGRPVPEATAPAVGCYISDLE